MKHLLLWSSFFWAFQLWAAEPSPENVVGATTVNVVQAKALWREGATFIDPRSTSDWEAGRIPSAIHLDQKNKSLYNPEHLATLVPQKSTAIVAYCNAHACHRAAHLARDLVSWGYSRVYYFRDGFPAWTAANNPSE